MTQHTDEPSVDDLLKWCDEIVSPFTTRHMDIKAVHAVARALRFRLSHPTLSADRLAEIQKAHKTDELWINAQPEGTHIAWLRQHEHRAELLAAHRADRNAVIEECAKVADRLTEPDGKKKGALYHMHVGSVTAAHAIAQAVRALKQ